MALTKAQTDTLRRLAAELQLAPYGQKRALVEARAETLGISAQSVYRTLREMGEPTRAEGPRKKRSDAGKRSVDRELAVRLGGLVHTARRANGKKTMTMELAADILRANGYGSVNQETGEVTMPSVSSLSRAMREYGCHPQQLKRGGVAAGTVRSPHPNWSWQADASVCVLYYLPGGKMSLMDERRYNDRKPGKLADIGNQRILRYLVVDHCTHSLYLHYAVGRGETAAGALAALIEAMSDRGPRDPMHGVPFHLYTDPGSAYRNSLLSEFCGRLNIHLQNHEPGRANATGSVEVAQNIVETQFESRLRFADVADLSGLQSLADNWRMHFNAHAVHSRLKMPRARAWSKILPEQLRTAERSALIAVSHWKLVERTVSDRLTIGVDTRLPGLPPQEYDLRNLACAGLCPKDRVRVELNPFSAPDIIVIKTMPDGVERRWEVSPIRKDEWGFDIGAPVMGKNYKSRPDTDVERILKEMAAASAAPGKTRARRSTRQGKATGVPDAPGRGKAAAPDSSARAFDIMADLREAPLTLRPKGISILDAAPKAAPMPLTHAQAALRLRALSAEAMIRDPLACMDYVRERFPEYLMEDKLDEVAAELDRRFGVGGGRGKERKCLRRSGEGGKFL